VTVLSDDSSAWFRYVLTVQGRLGRPPCANFRYTSRELSAHFQAQNEPCRFFGQNAPSQHAPTEPWRMYCATVSSRRRVRLRRVKWTTLGAGASKHPLQRSPHDHALVGCYLRATGMGEREDGAGEDTAWAVLSMSAVSSLSRSSRGSITEGGHCLPLSLFIITYLSYLTSTRQQWYPAHRGPERQHTATSRS